MIPIWMPATLQEYWQIPIDTTSFYGLTEDKSKVLSSSHSSVPGKVDLLNAKMQNKNSRYAHRLIYQLNE